MWKCVLLLQGVGDTSLAHQCLRLALVNNNHHAEAYNNLAVLEMRKGRVDQVSALRAQRAGCCLQRNAVLAAPPQAVTYQGPVTR